MCQGTITQSVSQGEIVVSGRNDILGRAISREEYPGRLRGVGFPLTRTNMYPTQKRPKLSEYEELKMKFDRLERLVNEKLNMPRNEEADRHEPNVATHSSARDSCTLVSPISVPEVIILLPFNIITFSIYINS